MGTTDSHAPSVVSVCAGGYGVIRCCRYLSSSQQAVDTFQEARIHQLMVLKEEADGLTLNPGLQHQRLQVAVEGLQIVTPRHTWRPYLQTKKQDPADGRSHSRVWLR